MDKEKLASRLVFSFFTIPISILLTVISWRIAAAFSSESVGEWVSDHWIRMNGVGAHPYEVGVGVIFYVDFIFWMFLLWSSALILWAMRRRSREEK